MSIVLSNCHENATAASLEYQRRFPNHRIPLPKAVSTTFYAFRGIGLLPSVRNQGE